MYGEVGLIVEYRKKYELRQTSYCYIAKVVGEKGKSELTSFEVEEGFETVWLSIQDAIIKLKESKPIVYEGPYMVARDLAFLEETYKMINI